MAEMAKIIGVTTRTIEREIPKKENIIRHVGPKNGGKWEIIQEISSKVTITTIHKPTTIKFKVINNQQKYIRSLPLHHSQQEIDSESDYSIFSIFVKPTFDLIQEFLKYGNNLEVIEPIELRLQLSKFLTLTQ